MRPLHFRPTFHALECFALLQRICVTGTCYHAHTDTPTQSDRHTHIKVGTLPNPDGHSLAAMYVMCARSCNRDKAMQLTRCRVAMGCSCSYLCALVFIGEAAAARRCSNRQGPVTALLHAIVRIHTCPDARAQAWHAHMYRACAQCSM